MENRIISFPRLETEYTKIIGNMFKNLGMEIKLPPKITKTTYNLGIRHSSDMMCFPYKVTLGTFMETLENGANTLLMFDSLGQCRLRHYHKIQEFTLQTLGYKNFELYGINKINFLKVIKKLSGKSHVKVLKEVINLFKNIKDYEEKRTIWSEDKPNIGIVGEIYSCIEDTVNYNLENKIRKFDANPYNTVTISGFLKQNFFKYLMKKSKYEKQAQVYLNGKLGGHGFENICNSLELIDKNIDGIIHVLPLSCMPETTVEPIINQICSDNKTPLLRITIDENNSEVNLETRLETFIELIKIKK